MSRILKSTQFELATEVFVDQNWRVIRRQYRDGRGQYDLYFRKSFLRFKYRSFYAYTTSKIFALNHISNWYNWPPK